MKLLVMLSHNKEQHKMNETGIEVILMRPPNWMATMVWNTNRKSLMIVQKWIYLLIIIEFINKKLMLLGIMIQQKTLMIYPNTQMAKYLSIMFLDQMLYSNHQLMSILRKLFHIIQDSTRGSAILDTRSYGGKSGILKRKKK